MDGNGGGGGRQRATTACDACSARRAKCDGAAPRCGRCERKDLDCLFTRSVKKRGPPKGSTSMKERLEKLEQMLEESRRAEARALQQTSPTETNGSRPVQRSSTGASGNSGSIPSESEYGSVARYPSDGMLGNGSAHPVDPRQMVVASPVPFEVGLQTQFLAPGQQLAFQPSVFPGLPSPVHAPNGMPFVPLGYPGTSGSSSIGVYQSAAMAPLNEPPAFAAQAAFPSNPASFSPPAPSAPAFMAVSAAMDMPFMVDQALYTSLIRTYFRYVWPTNPIFHPPSLLYRPSAYPSYVILSVLAMAIKFSSDPALDPIVASSPHRSRSELGEHIFLGVQQSILSRIFIPTRPVEAYEVAVLLQAAFAFGALSAHKYSGVRTVDTLLLLGRELPMEELRRQGRTGDDWIRWEERRRLLWMLFLYDRNFTVLSSVRYFTIPLERMEQLPMPCHDEVFIAGGPGPEAAGRVPVTLGMFMAGPQAYPLLLPQMSSMAKGIVLQYILTLVVDYQRDVHRTSAHKQFLEAQLRAWHDCLPHEESSAYVSSRPPTPAPADGMPRTLAVHVLIYYHWVQELLHTPPKGYNLLGDAEWLASTDFLVAAEHSSLLTGLLPAVEVELLPFWATEAVIFTTQLHIMLVKKISSVPAGDLQALHNELKERVEIAISVLDRLGERRPTAVFLCLALKLALHSAGLGDYFGDDPPPGDVGIESLNAALVGQMGFANVAQMVQTTEAYFGRHSRLLNTVNFFRGLFSAQS